MTDLALHLDATRARAACISPSGSYLPVLDTHGRSAMPLVVAVGLRGELLTGRSAWDVLLEKPESACGAFLPHVGTGRLFRFGNREADPAQLLATVLDSFRRLQVRAASVALTTPGYLDEAAVTEIARAVESGGWKVKVAAPSALAVWSAARQQTAAPTGLVCECDEHAMVLSLVEESAGRSRVKALRVLRNAGYPAWRRAIAAGLADATVRSCRRDPRATPGLDAVLGRHISAWIDEDGPPLKTLPLALEGTGWSVRLNITIDQVVEWCSKLLVSMRHAAMELLADPSVASPAKSLVLASTSRLPGIDRLAHALHDNIGGSLLPDALLMEQLAWIGAIRSQKATAGLWRDAPVFDPVSPTQKEADRADLIQAGA